MDFGEGIWVASRKKHRCEWCYWPIPKGERQYHYKGKYQGEWQDWRMHAECFEDYSHEWDEFIPGGSDPPDRIKEMYKTLGTSD